MPSENYLSLRDAATANNVEAFKALLTNVGSLIQLAELDTLFILSASSGHLGIAELLLAKGAHINTRMPLGDTALTWSIIKEKPEAVRFLIEKKIDVNAQTLSGNTALILAASRGQLGPIRDLVAAGAELGRTNKNEETAVMVAQKAEKTKAVELLLELETNYKKNVERHY
jgi:ankyrin repeat protein